MGFQAWRSLSVLVLTGAALVGCNNGQKDSRIVSGGPNNSNPYANVNQKSPGFNTAQQQFPTINKSTPPSPFPNTNPANSPFAGANSTPITGGNGMQPAGGVGTVGDLNKLGPLPNNSTPLNPTLPNNGAFAPSQPGPAFPPSGGSTFGDQRGPAPMPGGPGGYGPINVPPPQR
jgi:hypothetical protein